MLTTKKRNRIHNILIGITCVFFFYTGYSDAKAFTVQPAYISKEVHYNEKWSTTITVTDWPNSNLITKIQPPTDYNNPENIELVKAETHTKDKTIIIEIQTEVPENIANGTYIYDLYLLPTTANNSEKATTTFQSGVIIPIKLDVISNNNTLENNLKEHILADIQVKQPIFPLFQPYAITVSITNNTPYLLNPTGVTKVILESPTFQAYTENIDFKDHVFQPYETYTKEFNVRIWSLDKLKFHKAEIKAKVYNQTGIPISTAEEQIKRPIMIYVYFVSIISVILGSLVLIIRKVKTLKKRNKIIPSARLQQIAKS